MWVINHNPCRHSGDRIWHYNDVIRNAMASEITSLAIVYSTVYSRRRSKKTSKLCVSGLCAGNSPVTGEYPAQRTSIAEKVSIWWLHHGYVRNMHVDVSVNSCPGWSHITVFVYLISKFLLQNSYHMHKWRHLENSLKPRHNSHHHADDILYFFLYGNWCSSNQILLAFVLNGLIDNNLTLVQIMAWRRKGDKPLSLSIVTLFTDSYIRYSASMGQISSIHDDVIKWKHFPRNWPFVREIHRSRWILHTKASDAELWCFLWSASE